MESEILTYFEQERDHALLLLGVGLVSLLFASLVVLLTKKSVLLGFAYPTTIISLLLISLGGYMFYVLPSIKEDLQLVFLGTPNTFFEIELSRLSLALYKYTFHYMLELGVVVLGLVLCILSYRFKGLVFGIGLSLLCFGLVMFSYDFYSHQRALKYQKTILSFVSE